MSKQAVQTRILFRRKTQEPSRGKEFRNTRQNFLVFFVQKTKHNEKIQEIAFRNRFSGAKVKEKEERLTC
jgi:hypothetical protein